MSWRRASEDKRRMKKIYRQTRYSIAGGVYFSEKKGRYVRYYKSDYRHADYFRCLTNRTVRRTKDVASGGYYRRLFDYWWNLF